MKPCVEASVKRLWCARVDRLQLEKAGLLLRPFCLRRLKEDVEKSLPPRVCSLGCWAGLQVMALAQHMSCSRLLPARRRQSRGLQRCFRVVQSSMPALAERLTCCGGGQVETRINCPLSAMQTFWYRRLLLKDSKMLKSLEAEFSSDPNVQVSPVPSAELLCMGRCGLGALGQLCSLSCLNTLYSCPSRVTDRGVK